MKDFFNSKYRIPYDDTYYGFLLWGSVLFFLIRSIWSIVEGESIDVMMVYSVVFMVSTISLMMYYSRVLKVYSYHLYAGMSLVAFGLLWQLHDGVNGAYSYLFFTLIAIYAVILPGKSKMIYGVVLSLECLVLSEFSVPTPEQVDEGVVISYVINMVLIAVTVIYLKRFYDQRRTLYYQHNSELDQVNETVLARRMKLLHQRNEIEVIKRDLQQTVEKNTVDLKRKNAELSRIAYSNAHHLRAPLTNILAIVDLMSQETEKGEEAQQLAKIARESTILDQSLRKVNELLD
ncbi:hypothetical protein BFP72_03525 [Reichenbachiella sp. 5M10]|uniref:hypothetical protein n=1 Tax=Reichenbachiella sp. 5M10 TaxID=1889772 RepID=UPI000C14B1C7|nr:hypothetical protein [Reichenbachiella sp. 5M10]PIB34545.1 hypothetical protein BFP72_03525 [Reichenbachiella sp. 5M10]